VLRVADYDAIEKTVGFFSEIAQRIRQTERRDRGISIKFQLLYRAIRMP
jgi:hypothetical protein